MANHWPVVVGINQYQSLQPLRFAQFDAVELKDFLLGEAGLPPQQCSLLTDIAPMVYQGAAFPTREVIRQRLQQTCERALPEDTVWVFFSGYGMHWQGQDFLMPIDGDPANIEATGIALQTVFEMLQDSRAHQCLLILDMNRSQSALPQQRLGVATMELAKQLEIPLILSCRPNQFSQETLAVRHGLFTEALLEGLRFQGCLTLSQLAAYLNKRLPELCYHHFRPEQNIVSVIPTQYQFLMLVPPQAVGRLTTPEIPAGTVTYGNWAPSTSDGPVRVATGHGGNWRPKEAQLPTESISSAEPMAQQASTPENSASDNFAPVDEPESDTDANPARQTDPGRSIGWQKWLLVGAGLLLLGVLLRNQSTFLGNRQSSTDDVQSVETLETLPNEPPEAEVEPTGDEPPVQADGVIAEPLFPEAGGAGEVEPQVAIDQARRAIEQRRFGEALNWLAQVPEAQRSEDFAVLQEQARAGYDNVSRDGKAVLNSARQIIEPLSASRFNDAIEEARQVPEGDEFYPQAQADIARWSAVILDLAQGRAANGDFNGAIAAAGLVPQDQGDTYAQAQADIRTWQQQKVNRQLLQDAQARLRPDQATSFEEAIQLVQQIPADTPEYAVAQQRIDQWSQDILVIARARAADGQIPGAIAAAELVPPGTSAYDQAQEEIMRWRGQ